MNLNTKYLGVSLPHPLIVGASTLTDDPDMVRQLEDAGAAALVLRSMYEEEIAAEQMSAFFNIESHSDAFSEATSYEPDPEQAFGPDEYLEHLQRVKRAVKIPVIGSLNGTTLGGWTSYVHQMEQAGADAVELNLYHAASDPSMNSAQVEAGMIEILRDVKKSIHIPVAVKLSPLFTAFTNFALQLDEAGADAIVLFNRFHHVDIDVVELEVLRSLELSTSADLEPRLKGCAVIAGRVKCALAISGGVHTALDVIKATMAGANVTQMVSALYQNGPQHLKTVLADLQSWMEENEWTSLDEMRGNMSFGKIPDPAAYERANFRMMYR